MLDKVKEGVLFMKTHELEKELGISKHTIFYYEKEGIVTPQRDENGYRSYSQDDLQKLIMVKFLRNLNISIDDVKAILNNELDFKECLEINQIHLEKQIKNRRSSRKYRDVCKKRFTNVTSFTTNPKRSEEL